MTLCEPTEADPFCRRHPWAIAHVEDFSTEPVLWREVDRLDAWALLALPPSPLCARCGHQLCPCCPVPCCDLLDCVCFAKHDGICEVDLNDYAAWLRQLEGSRPDEEAIGFYAVALQEGPFWPGVQL